MVHLIDGVCGVAAGTSWMDFRNRCVNKVSEVVEENIVESIDINTNYTSTPR